MLDVGLTLPSVAGLAGEIGSLALKAEGLVLPDVGSLQGTIGSLVLLEDLMLPTVTGLVGVIGSVTLDADIDLPTLTGLTGQITNVTSGVVASPQIDVTASISGVLFNPAIDSPVIAGLAGRIDSAALDPTIDPPTVTGLAGTIDSLTLDPDIDLPSIRIPATAVVGGETGGSRQRGDDEEDPENPILNLDGIAQPVALQGVINATLNKLFDEPIILQGRIDATVNYLTGANVDQENAPGGGGAGVQRSQVAEDLSRIANVLEGAAVSGNLNPALGDTPRVDIPTPNLDIDNQPVPGASHPQGYGDALGDENQFAPRAGGGGRAGATAGALRVTFPTETLSKLAQEATLSKQLAGANQHLATIRTNIANDIDFATEATLAGIASTLDSIRNATEKIADAPLVQQLVDEGVQFPNNPTDPTNAALTQSPAIDILSQGGLELFAAFDNISKLLQSAQGLAGPGPDLSQIGGAGSPLHIKDVDISTTRKVEVVNLPETQKVQVINDKLNVEQVGVVQVTQAGEWVIQLASGATIPVYVQGGHVTADIAGGLEGLAIRLADEEVGLRAVGAI